MPLFQDTIGRTMGSPYSGYRGNQTRRDDEAWASSLRRYAFDPTANPSARFISPSRPSSAPARRAAQSPVRASRQGSLSALSKLLREAREVESDIRKLSIDMSSWMRSHYAAVAAEAAEKKLWRELLHRSERLVAEQAVAEQKLAAAEQSYKLRVENEVLRKELKDILKLTRDLIKLEAAAATAPSPSLPVSPTKTTIDAFRPHVSSSTSQHYEAALSSTQELDRLLSVEINRLRASNDLLARHLASVSTNIQQAASIASSPAASPKVAATAAAAAAAGTAPDVAMDSTFAAAEGTPTKSSHHKNVHSASSPQWSPAADGTPAASTAYYSPVLVHSTLEHDIEQIKQDIHDLKHKVEVDKMVTPVKSSTSYTYYSPFVDYTRYLDSPYDRVKAAYRATDRSHLEELREVNKIRDEIRDLRWKIHSDKVAYWHALEDVAAERQAKLDDVQHRLTALLTNNDSYY